MPSSRITTPEGGEETDREAAAPLTERLAASVPCGILLMDPASGFIALNSVLERTLGIPDGLNLDHTRGEVPGCLFIKEGQGCGHRPSCDRCPARALAIDAIASHQTRRVRAFFQIETGGRFHDVELLLSASPMEWQGRRCALVLLEDISRMKRSRLGSSQVGFHGIVGRDYKMRRLCETIRAVAQLGVPVLIQGESGTGKELAAMAIHQESPRASAPIIPLNCGVLSEELLQTELFGHVKGAFTGAIRDKKGRFELADGGSIFLDEIGELSPSMQVKLLRVLQDGSFERVGGETTIRVNTRVICATNRDLEKEVAEGRFRADLFYRLAVVPITVPPLRERREDLPLLAEHLLETIAQEHGRVKPAISERAMEMLELHSWRGNVRELENVLNWAVIQCRGPVIHMDHLPASLLRKVGRSDGSHAHQRVEADEVREALRQAHGNKVLTARMLGISRATLYRILDSDDHGKSAG